MRGKIKQCFSVFHFFGRCKTVGIFVSTQKAIDVEEEIWKTAGIVGINPGPFSWRELDRMARGKMMHDWSMITPLILFAANPNLPKGKQLTYEKVNPFAKELVNDQPVQTFTSTTWGAFCESI